MSSLLQWDLFCRRWLRQIRLSRPHVACFVAAPALQRGVSAIIPIMCAATPTVWSALRPLDKGSHLMTKVEGILRRTYRGRAPDPLSACLHITESLRMDTMNGQMGGKTKPGAPPCASQDRLAGLSSSRSR